MKLADLESEKMAAASEHMRQCLVDWREPGFSAGKKDILLIRKLDMNLLEKWNPRRSPSVWDPMREMEEMQNRVASLFGRRLPLKRESGEEEITLTEWIPPVDIAEDDKEYLIKIELPGVNKEDVRVSLEGGVLSISGERKAEQEEKNKKYHRIERTYGSFARSFTLPEGTASDKVSAEFKDGVLRVHLPKDETAKPQSIDVKIA